MQILKAGKIPGDIKYRGTCCNCKCQVEVLGKETTMKQAEYNTIDRKVACPTRGCENEILVFVHNNVPCKNQMDR